MLQESIDFEDDYHVKTEWDTWDEFVQDGYEKFSVYQLMEEQNCNGISGYSWILLESGEAQKAYEVVRRVTWGISCYADNSFLFMRAKQLAEHVGKHEESKWYQEQLDKFEKSMHNWEMGRNIRNVVGETSKATNE